MSDITISGVFKNSWLRLSGSKAALWSIAIVVVLIAITVEYCSKWIMMSDSQSFHYFSRYILIPIIMNLLIGPFYGGSMMVAIKRARHEDVTMKTGYQHFHRIIEVAVTMTIVGLLSNIVVIITNTPSIDQKLGHWLPYFDLAGALFSLAIYSLFLLSVPLIIDKGLSMGQALSQSAKKVKPHWLRIYLVFFLAYLILFIVYLPTVVGLAFNNAIIIFVGVILFVAVMIWFLPFLFLLGGDIYQKLVD